MKNRKGMSLIEVVVAIFLIGLIAVSFFPAIMSSFAVMKKGKAMTVDIFKTQQNIELEMEQIRDKIDEKIIDPTKNDPRDFTVNAFGKTIKGSSIEKSIVGANDFIYALIASGHIVEENLPEVSRVKLNQSEPAISPPPIFIKGADVGIKMQGNHDMKSMSNYFTDLKKWYISNEGFDGYIPNIVANEDDWSTRYPSWPNDYTAIKNNNTNIMLINDSYIGRHLVYSVIPVSKTGRYGLERGSTPIYINGPPILADLSLHLDTYVLEKPDSEVFKIWNDLNSSNVARTSGHGIELKYDNAKWAIFNNSKLTFDKSLKNSNELTLFLVLKNPGSNFNQEIISKTNRNSSGWSLKIMNGNLEFSMNDESRKVISDSVIDNNNYIITIKATTKSVKMIIDKDGSTEEKVESFRTNLNFNNINYSTTSIGSSFSDLEISEIIAYSSELSGDFNEDDEVYKIRNYLANKHGIKLVP